MDGNLTMGNSLEIDRPDLELQWHINSIKDKIKKLKSSFTIFTVGSVMSELIELNKTVFYEEYTTHEDRRRIKFMLQQVAIMYKNF